MDFRTIAKVGVDGASPFARVGRAREDGHLEMPRGAARLFSASVPSPVPSLARLPDVHVFGCIVPASGQR